MQKQRGNASRNICHGRVALGFRTPKSTDWRGGSFETKKKYDVPAAAVYGDVGPSSSLPMFLGTITQGETPHRKSKIYRSWSRARPPILPQLCGANYRPFLYHSYLSFPFLYEPQKIISLQNFIANFP